MRIEDRPADKLETQTDLLAHLVSVVYRGTHAAIVFHAVLAGLLLATVGDLADHTAMALWLLALAGILAVRAVFYRLYYHDEKRDERTDHWLKAIRAVALLMGIVWGATAWVFMPETSVVLQVFTAMILLVITAGAVSKFYAVPDVVAYFIVPIVTMVLLRMIEIGTPLHIAVGAAAFLLVAFLFYFAKLHHDELINGLNLAWENRKLLTELKRENREVTRDYVEKEHMEKLLRKKSMVLDSVSKIQLLFMEDRAPDVIFKETLQIILDLAKSDFGFIGEVQRDEQGRKRLSCLYESPVVWDDATQRMLNGEAVSMELDEGVQFGDVLITGEPLIANGLDRPVLKSILSVPLYVGESLVGVIGVANREKGYDVTLLTMLEPVLSTCAQMIVALQDRRARDKALMDLESAVEETAKASRAKTEFLSSMSHELRTPMNAVLGFAQLLQMNPKVPLHEKQADSVEQILKAGNHLLELINEILDLSRIEAGRVKLDMDDLDPHEVLADCVSYITPLANRRGVELIADVPRRGQFTVHTDRTRLRQVLLNLLSNAVKYNKADGQVRLSVERTGGGFLRFLVTDTGPGIPEERQNELFEPFSRLGAETTDIEGTGIGLTIARNLARMMGGDLNFHSQLGTGSEFWVDMPGGIQAAAPKTPALSQIEVPHLPEGSYTVLYIEDSRENAELMEKIISMLDGVKYLCAPTGELGLEIAEAHQPDVIMVDLHLPGIDGFEVFHRLRARPETRDTPIIAVSADAMPADVQQGLEVGFDAYLTKPIHVGQVLEHITLALEDKLGPVPEDVV